MLNSIILKDLFSFKGENKIDLNKGVNLLLGINGSGKTSFINAIRLLQEGISGAGIENLIQSQWGGFYQIANCTGRDKSEEVQLTYIFDFDDVRKTKKEDIASNLSKPYHLFDTIEELASNIDYSNNNIIVFFGSFHISFDVKKELLKNLNK